MAIQQSMQIAGIEPDPTSSLASDLKEAHKVAFARLDEKIKLLSEKYSKDIFMQDCVITTSLKHERSKQLFGIESSDIKMPYSDQLLGPEFENYMNEKIAKKNWDVVFNLSLTLGRSRQAQLFGLNEAAIKFDELLQRILKLNHFALTADVDFNIQFTDGEGKLAIKAFGKIETTDKVYVSMSRTRDGCKWTLQLYEPDFATAKVTEYYIPMHFTAGVKSVKDDKGNWIDYN
jgi:hypothetical protein